MSTESNSVKSSSTLESTSITSTIAPHLSSHLCVPAQLRQIDGRSERVDRAALLLYELNNDICDDFGYSFPGHERLEKIGGSRCSKILEELEERQLLEINHRHCFRTAGSDRAFKPFRKKYKLLDCRGELVRHEITSKAGLSVLQFMRDEVRQSASAGRLEQQTLENLQRLALPADFKPETSHEAAMASQFMSGFLGTITRCKYGRLHSPLTRTERRIRSVLRLDGKPDSLIEVDVSCCQPLLMAIMSGDQRMIESCGTRRFYDEIAGCLSQPRMQVKAKQCFMWWMFRARDAETKEYTADISSFMSRRYPKTLRTWSMYDGDHLAHLLQRRESMLMIDRVLNSLFNAGIFAVSIHDSFLVRPEDRETVVAAIAAAFPPVHFSVTTAADQMRSPQLIEGTSRHCVA